MLHPTGEKRTVTSRATSRFRRRFPTLSLEMVWFAPDVADTPEDRGRLPALDAEAVRNMAAFSMVSKARVRRFAELDEDDDTGSDTAEDSDAEELEERARKKRKGSDMLPCATVGGGTLVWRGMGA